MKIKFTKLVKSAVAPKQGTAGAAGFDLTATSRFYSGKHGTWEYGTGIAVEIPPGYAGLVMPRSSIFKTGLVLSNGVGLIDSDYRGEVKAKFHIIDDQRMKPYEVGDRIAQLVIVPIPEVEYVEVDKLTETERGTGGYGSTGK